MHPSHEGISLFIGLGSALSLAVTTGLSHYHYLMSAPSSEEGQFAKGTYYTAQLQQDEYKMKSGGFIDLPARFILGLRASNRTDDFYIINQKNPDLKRKFARGSAIRKALFNGFFGGLATGIGAETVQFFKPELFTNLIPAFLR